jgi:hypothetical protein
MFGFEAPTGNFQNYRVNVWLRTRRVGCLAAGPSQGLWRLQPTNSPDRRLPAYSLHTSRRVWRSARRETVDPYTQRTVSLALLPLRRRKPVSEVLVEEGEAVSPRKRIPH